MSDNENKLEITSSSNYNFLIKIKNFFTKLFSKSINLALAPSPEATDEKAIQFNSKYKNTSIEKIQKLYEAGKIKEEEFPDTKLEELKQLYVDQITKLDEDAVKFNAKTI